MKSRLGLGVGLLALFLLLGILTWWWAEGVCRPVAEDLDRAALLVSQGEAEAGERLAERACQRWQTGWKMMAALTDHAPMDEIDGLFARMEYFSRAEDPFNMGACCARLSRLVEAVADDHQLCWWNLL